VSRRTVAQFVSATVRRIRCQRSPGAVRVWLAWSARPFWR